MISKRLLLAVLGCIILGSGAKLVAPQAGTQSADRNAFVWACGYKLPTDRYNPGYVRGMRKDCGIFGPSGASEAGGD